MTAPSSGLWVGRTGCGRAAVRSKVIRVGPAASAVGVKGVGRPHGRDQLHLAGGGRRSQGSPLQVEARVVRRQRRGRHDRDLLVAGHRIAAVGAPRDQDVGGDIAHLGIVAGGAPVDGAQTVGGTRGGAAVGRQGGEGRRHRLGGVHREVAGRGRAAAGPAPAREVVGGVVSSGPSAAPRRRRGASSSRTG